MLLRNSFSVIYANEANLSCDSKSACSSPKRMKHCFWLFFLSKGTTTKHTCACLIYLSTWFFQLVLEPKLFIVDSTTLQINNCHQDFENNIDIPPLISISLILI